MCKTIHRWHPLPCPKLIFSERIYTCTRVVYSHSHSFLTDCTERQGLIMQDYDLVMYTSKQQTDQATSIAGDGMLKQGHSNAVLKWQRTITDLHTHTFHCHLFELLLDVITKHQQSIILYSTRLTANMRR